MAREQIEININVDDIVRQLRGIKGLAEKGISRGLNDAAFGLRTFWIADLNTFLDKPTAFTKKVFVKKSTPDNLTALTFLPRIQSEYLNLAIEGGVRRVGDYATLDGAILTPVKARVNTFGNFASGPKRWLATVQQRIKKSFIGSPDGSGDSNAVYQRLAKGRLKLLAVFRETIQYEKQLPLERTTETFVDDADRIMQKNLDRLLRL